jgi:hypothetical protein
MLIVWKNCKSKAENRNEKAPLSSIERGALLCGEVKLWAIQ